MELTEQLGNHLHVHPYSAVTKDEHGHRHALSGYTAPGPDTPGHVHHFAGVSTFNLEHVHRFGDTTGPASLGPSEHTHPLLGYTSCDLGHSHRFEAVTGEGVE